MSEFDITGKILLPYLKDLGIDASEISFENSFSIRLGRKKHAIGRSDMLCTRHGKNLFVIEVKNESKQITAEDRDQGISYARLLDEIAPFTIISNGISTKIYDTVTKAELSGNIAEKSAFWKNGHVLSTEDELKIRYEALRNFIAMSPENLRFFCESQVNDRMGQIVGDTESPYAKFVKKLFVQRKDLTDNFESFLASEDPVFGMVGAAGVGKTNALCSLALQKLENSFVFFYNAAIISSPLEAISQDLNIAFSSRTETDVVLKKLNEIGRFADKTVLIFIDAIDECTNPKIAQELSDMALLAKNADKIKIIVSCKTNIWNSIIKIQNTPTHLYDELNHFHQNSGSLDNPGYELTDFNDQELFNILPLYQKEFGLKGTISPDLLPELRNGFFLKIFSEVYSGKQMPEKINDKDLILKYLKKTLEKTKMGFTTGLRTLAAIGNLIMNYEYNDIEIHKKEGIDVNYILEKLEYALDANLPEDLFTRNVLIRSNSEDSYTVSFYYSKIRDYIISFQSHKLDKKSDNEFYNILCDFYQNHISKSALDFYIENSCSSHKNTLIQFKQDKALNYTVAYDAYIEENFAAFKEKFTPHTRGEIGIILPKDLIKGDGYALYPIGKKINNKIIHLDLRDPFDGPYENNPFFKTGAKSYYTSNVSLFVKDQTKVIRQDIVKQLREIIKKGKISSFSSDILLLEQLAVILYFNHKKLNYNYNLKDYSLPRYEGLYPINLLDLKNRVERFKIIEHYRFKNIAAEELEKIIENTLKNNLPIPEYNAIGDAPPFQALSKIVNILLEKGYEQITEHYMPVADVTLDKTKQLYEQHLKVHSNNFRTVQYSEIKAKEYTITFFKHLETSYKEFVEYNFPTFKNSFNFYNTMPHEYFVYLKDSDILQWGSFGYRSSQTDSFNVYFKDWDDKKEAYIEEHIEYQRLFSMETILRINDYIRYPIPTFDGIRSSQVDENSIIRNWLYKILESDMKDVFKKLEC
ncbi:type I restriction enzyme HsdR N-terminal domain-containing protein [Flavobacterium denitrificans]|uniref:type I restriction enzyme HsdR N-terminal domain-containing protein n=1 Tax=Flavobacterium denitrificans TaxID=281361 RepID=UPI00047A48BE|nr:type I restriction enzyme HsdR N-terminal domain-containing protein [Flavobacterium denitrificans]